MSTANNGSAHETKALTPRVPVPLEPTTLDEAWRMAEAMAKSTFVPKAYQGNPGNVLAAMMLARDYGVSFMTVMREVYFVNDRPSFYAEFVEALARASPHCEYITCIKTTATECVYRTKRRGTPEPFTLTVKIDDIPAALRKKDTWTGYPANMLRARCRAWISSLEYPDATLGIKSAEELEDIQWVEREPRAPAIPRTTAPALPESRPVEIIEPAREAGKVLVAPTELPPEWRKRLDDAGDDFAKQVLLAKEAPDALKPLVTAALNERHAAKRGAQS